MSLPIFTNPSEDFIDIDFFEFDVYVLMLEAFDPEGTEIQYQVVEEFGDGALFYITPDYNELAFIADPDFEDPSDLDQDNVYEVKVRAEDRDSEEDYRTIYVHVHDVDEGNNNPPEFVSAGFVEVAENPEVAVYIAEAQDPDGDPVTYEITGGVDQHLFSIDPETGEVYFNDVLDFEYPQDAEGDNFYEIEITASDGYSETDPHSVVIQVTDLDDTAPVLEGDVDFSVEENTAEVPYAVVAYDPEGGETNYDLGGPDGHLFQLGPDGELSFFYAPDFEAPGDADGDNVYEINIVATDEAGNESAMQTVTVTVEDLSDSAPIITSTEDTAEFFENYYDAIYTVEAIDADLSDTVTFRFSDDSPDAGYFIIDEHSGAIYPIMPFDHEDPQDSDGDNVYELVIIASDGVNDSDPFVLYVTILNENDNVPVMSEEGAEFSVPENITGTIYTAVALDDDGDPLEYILGGIDAHLFYLDPYTGELSFLSPPNFEAPLDEGGDNIYDVEIIASDGENESDVTAVSIIVADEAEEIIGTPDPDVLIGTSEDDVIKGLGSNDTLRGRGGADALDGGAGSDWADYVGSVQGITANLATGVGSGGDAEGDTYTSIENVRGSSWNDVLRGDGHANLLRGGIGADTLNGGAGGDWADFFGAAAGVAANLATGGTGGEAAGDTYFSIENIRGSNFGDSLAGNAGNNYLRGGSGADTLEGGAGSDWADYFGAAAGVAVDLAFGGSAGDAAGDNYTSIENVRGTGWNDILKGEGNINFLRGGSGGDTLDGAGGSDWADYFGATASVTVDLALGGSDGEADGDTYISVENVRGSSWNDMLRGNGENNLLRGDGGADTLDGAGGSDWADYFGAATGVVVNLTLGGSVGDANGDVYISIENIRGSKWNDVLGGNGQNNLLRGGSGADTLDGGGGSDYADYFGAAAAVTVNLATGGMGGDANGDAYTSIENIRGSSFGDILTGDAHNNVLRGALGNDTLDGGAGSDSFAFDTALNGTTNVDTILGFTVGEDTIRLENSIFTALSTPGALAANFFGVGPAASTSNTHIVYNDQTGALYFDADGIGGAAQVQIATLSAHLSLTNQDFFVV